MSNLRERIQQSLKDNGYTPHQNNGKGDLKERIYQSLKEHGYTPSESVPKEEKTQDNKTAEKEKSNNGNILPDLTDDLSQRLGNLLVQYEEIEASDKRGSEFNNAVDKLMNDNKDVFDEYRKQTNGGQLTFPGLVDMFEKAAQNKVKEQQKEEQKAAGTRDATIKDITVNSFKRGFNNAIYGEERYKEMEGRANNAEAYKQKLSGEEYNFAPDNIVEKAVSGASEQLGQMARNLTNPTTTGMMTAAGATALIAGNAGPQALVPEEVISVPAAMGAAYVAGSAASNMKIEAGLAYDEMLENGISKSTATKIALGVGGANAALEAVQIDELMKSFKVLGKSKATKGAAEKIADYLLKRGMNIAEETAQETAQEAVTITGAQIANKAEKGEWAYNAEEVKERLKDTASSSALTFGALGVGGDIAHLPANIANKTISQNNSNGISNAVSNANNKNSAEQSQDIAGIDIQKQNADIDKNVNTEEGKTKDIELKASNISSYNLARDIIKENNSTLKVSDISDKLKEVQEILSSDARIEERIEKAYDIASEIGAKVAENSQITNSDIYDTYKDLRDKIRNTPVSISNADKADIGGVDSFNEFRKNNFGSIRISNNGMPIDSFYQELSEMYPNFFDAQKETHPAEQLMKIQNVLDDIKPVTRALSDEEMEAVSADVANKVFNGSVEIILPLISEEDTVTEGQATDVNGNSNAESVSASSKIPNTSGLTQSVAEYMDSISVGAPADTSHMAETNAIFQSEKDVLFDKEFVSRYADDFVAAIANKNGSAYQQLSVLTDNLAGELINYTLTGQSSLSGNKSFEVTANAFKTVLTDAVNKNAALHNNAYGNSDILNAQVNDIRNGDFSAMNVSRNYDYGLVQDEYSAQLDVSEREAIDELAKACGTTVKIVPSLADGETMLNGMYDGGVIYLALDADEKITSVFSHELTHHFEKTAPQAYARYKTAVLEVLTKNNNLNTDELVNRVKELYGDKITYDKCVDELVADYTHTILKDTNKMLELVETAESITAEEKQGFIKSFLEAVKGLLKRLNAWISKYTGSHNEEIERIKRTETELEQMAAEAADNKQKTVDNSSNIRFMIAGKKSNTADLQALQNAQQLEAKNVDAETIWKETGWGKGQEGQWKFEIDDSKAEFNRQGFTEKPSKVSDYFKNTELFEAYPHLRDIDLRFEKMEEGEYGKYNPETNVITLNSSDGAETNKESLIHELQHAIQNNEGFAEGTTPEYWERRREDIVSTIANAQKNLDLWLNDIGYPEYRKKRIDQFLKKAKEVKASGGLFNELQNKLQIDLQNFKNNSKYAEQIKNCENELEEFRREYDKITNGMTAYEQYQNTAGEIEARDVEKRVDMTSGERRNAFPKSMKPNDNVVFADDNGAQYSKDKSFAEQVHDALNGASTGNNHIYVGETTSILKQLGLNDKPMLITEGHIKDINHKKVKGITKYHGLSEDTINKLPHILDYPAIVFDSFSSNNSDAVCILSEVTDNDGLPIMVVVKPDGQGRYNNVMVDSNFILTMYGKDNPQSFINEIGRNIDNVLFVDQKRTQDMLRANRLYLPKIFSTLKFNTIIHKSKNIVNVNSEKNNSASINNNEPIVKNSLKESTGDTQTKSDNFKQWFGDWENDPENASKVVNEDGTPKIVYHGTSKGGFNSFDTYGSNFGLFGNGSYFTESENVAKSYTNKGKGTNKQVYSVYLDIKNPIDMDAPADILKWNKAFEEQDIDVTAEMGDSNEQVYRKFLEELEYNYYSKYEAEEIISDIIQNAMGYDGITHIGGGRVRADSERHRVWIAFNPEQIKSATGNVGTFDKNNADIRYSIKKNKTDTDKNLMAIHNLSEKKLKENLQLGGFPAPSIAVTKADIGHNGYGDISVVFGRDTIDPAKSSNNRLYSADAYTSRFPQIDYKLNEDALNRLSERLNMSVSQLEANIFDTGDKERIISKMKASRQVQEAFIKENNFKVEPVLHAPKPSKFGTNANEAVYLLANDVTYEQLVNNADIRSDYFRSIEEGSNLKGAAKKFIEKLDKQLDAAKNKPEIFEREQRRFNNDIKILNGEGEKVEDAFSYSEGVNNVIKENQSEFDNFAENLVNEVLENKYIRKDIDPFDEYGNSRDFDEMHTEYTLENIVRAMNSGKNQESGIFGAGIGEMRSAVSQEYGTVEDMKNDSGRIQKLSDEEIDNIYSKSEKLLSDIISDLAPLIDTGNNFTDMDIASENVKNALLEGTDKKGIKRYLAEYINGVSDATIDKIVELAENLKNIPVKYFEAKPHRAIGFDEVKAVILPDNTDTNLKKQLKDMGINTVEYKSGDDDDRQRALESVDTDVRFSRKVGGENLVDLIERYGTIPKGEKAVRDVEVPKQISETQYVSRFARTAMEAGVTPDDAISEFEKAILDGTMAHEVITNKNAMAHADRILRTKSFRQALDSWDALIDSGHSLNKNDIALGQQLYNQCVNNKDVTHAMKIAADLAAEATRAGQSLQAVRMLKMLTPDGKLYYLERSVDEINKEFRNKLGDKYKDVELSEKLMKQFIEAKTDGKRNEVYDKLCQNIADQIPSTVKDKWNSWRYLVMLGNPRTHIRNIVGNGVFYPAVRIKGYMNAVLEKGFVNKDERTSVLKKSKASKEYAAKDFKIMQKELQGINAKYAMTDDIESKRKIFKTGALEFLRKKNSDLLEAEDLWFLKRHYEDAFAKVMTARGIDADLLDSGTKEGNAALQKIRVIAMREAQEATYRDANSVASALNKLQRNADRSQSAAVRMLGTGIEAVMPFKKTPLNIAKRGIEYSPVGLLNGIWSAATSVKNGKITAAEAVNKISKGFVGTGITMLGFLLANMGIVTGEGDDNKKKSEFDGMVGKQTYALNISGKSYTIDWMAPISMPLFIGVELQKATEDKDWSLAKVVNALSTISAPLLELSCLSSISSAIESAQYSSSNVGMAIAWDMATSYLTQALPTLGGQIARMIDKKKRNAYYKDKESPLPTDIQTLIGQVEAKIPFASFLLEPQIDSWGREKTYGALPERILENSVSPGYYSEEYYTKVDKELERLNKKVDGADMFPVAIGKTLTIDGVEYSLDVHQYTKAARLRGQKSFELVSALMNNEIKRKPQGKKNAVTVYYDSLSDEEKVEQIKKCYTEALDYVKEEMGEELKKSE